MTSISRVISRVTFLLVFFICNNASQAQGGLADTIVLEESLYTSIELINIIETNSELTFIYNPSDIINAIKNESGSEITIRELLDKIVNSNRLKYKVNEDQIILYRPIKKKKIPVHTINGYIEDYNSRERLIGSHILCASLSKGTISNESGYFSLTLPRGNVDILATYIGYQEFSTMVRHKNDTTIIIRIKPDTYLNEIEIIAEKKQLSERSEMSTINLSQKELKNNPSFLGENDIIQSIKSLPGVASTNDLTAGLIVRGGSQDQNLVLLDGVTLYNISHLAGIFSIFNSDVVKTSTLIKGAFPARYGGRLSSILDIRMNDGDLQQIHGTASISLIASKFTLQGPIVKDKTSFIISGRRSYADLLVKPFTNSKKDLTNGFEQIKPEFNFYDVYFKMQHIISKKQRVYLNLYKGRDTYGFTSLSNLENSVNELTWGNNLASIRWNWEVNNKLFLNTSFNYLNFNQAFSYRQEIGNFNKNALSSVDYKSDITDISSKINIDYVPSPAHFIRMGVLAQQHGYNPGSSVLREENLSNSVDTTILRKAINSTELNAYIEDDMTWNRLTVNAGLHASSFFTEGKIYSSLQPRISANYVLDQGLSLKAAYSRMSQYNYLVTSETSFFISDLWITSTKELKPQNSWQISTGVAFTATREYEVSVEAYYKRMENLLSFKRGIENTFGSTDPDWESQLIEGDGQSYGVELFARKSKGKLNGWIAYTLSWNTRQFDGINEGNQYPFKYDNRHQFSIVGNYNISKKIDFSFQWSYASGRYTTISTATIPSQFVQFNNNPVDFINGVDVPQGRNNYRLSPSHRLDFNFSFIKVKNRYTRTWSIGLINAYFSKDPVYVRTAFIRDPNKQDSVIKKIEEVSLLPVIPSISYRIEF